MNVPSSSRIRSGEAWARWSCRTRAGSILDGAVIVMLHFEGAVRGSLEGSRGDRVRLRRHAHRATGTPLWWTPLRPAPGHEMLAPVRCPLVRPDVVRRKTHRSCSEGICALRHAARSDRSAVNPGLDLDKLV